MKPGNIFSEIPDSVKDEIFEALLKTDLDFETNWGLDNSPFEPGEGPQSYQFASDSP
jgi:hypothetical protein